MTYSRLLNYLWHSDRLTGLETVSVTGERVAIVSRGEAAEWMPGIWMGAEVVVDGERMRGAVAVGEDTPVPEGAILRVTETPAAPVLGADDRLVTQIEYTLPPEARECYDALRAGAAEYACAGKIAGMDSLHRTSLYTALSVERLQRKTAHIMEVFAASDADWNQTFHVLLLRAMGGDRNREAFTALAGRATAAMASREKGSPLRGCLNFATEGISGSGRGIFSPDEGGVGVPTASEPGEKSTASKTESPRMANSKQPLKVEALLLGAAGFLLNGDGGRSEFEEKDDYTLRLEEEARHLLAKYSIVPLKPAEWNLSRLYPANHPAVRLAEIAALLCKKDFMLDGMLRCRTSEEVERLFSVEASEYWRTHYTPSGAESAPSAKTIGRAKARLIGINLAAPLMFAYGRETGLEELCERALDLLATIPAERNHLLAGWYGGGCVPESGFESQALLQLGGEYCAKGACADCRVGRAELKNAISAIAYNS